MDMEDWVALPLEVKPYVFAENGGNFGFIDNMSPLAKNYKFSWFDGKYDAYEFIRLLIRVYWMPDILYYPKRAMSEKYYRASEVEHILRELGTNTRKLITLQEVSQSEDLTQAENWYYDRSQELKSDLYSAGIGLVRAMIEDKYQYGGECVGLRLSEYDKQLLLNPDKYILQYFHDMMIFMNYLQVDREYWNDDEVMLIKSRACLTESPDLDRIFGVVSTTYRDWWT